MTKTVHKLTPAADQTPVTVSIEARELSGAQWVSRFPGSASLDDLAMPFRDYASAFVGALRNAGATVTVSATFRPLERAYLMHWAWMIAKASQDPQTIPAMAGVNIRWDHQDDNGKYSSERSIDAAKAMTRSYGIDSLGVAPALISRHTARCATDISIHWQGPLEIQSADGNTVRILGTPRTGMNSALHVVGATYGVIKYNQSGHDRPHWSDTGA